MKRTLIFATFLFVSGFTYCQAVSLLFKSIKYASYRMDNGKPDVDFYSEIDEKGLMTVYKKVFEGPKTTTVKLSTDNMDVLNSIFNGSQKLGTSVVKTRFEPGVHYAGEYYFIAYTDLRGMADSLSFIRPFMSATFITNFDKLQDISAGSKEELSKKVLNIDTKFLNSLVESHRKTTYLPKFEAPPPGM